MTYLDAFQIIQDASLEWIERNVHPFVKRERGDTDASFTRKMAQHILATGKKPKDFRQTGL